MSNAKRIDANQPAIVAALEAAGYTVAITSSLGRGFPDLVVGSDWVNVLMEIKTQGAKLTGDYEPKFHALWRGPKAIVYTAEQALQVMQWYDAQFHAMQKMQEIPF